MSRSRRKNIIKDKGCRDYWRTVRRVQNHHMKRFPRNVDITWAFLDWDFVEQLLSVDIPNPKSIVNDYDYCDYIFRDCEIESTRK